MENGRSSISSPKEENEWTIYKPADQQIEFHIHGGLGELGREESYLQRHPWEAFARVGFRTVINVPAKEQ